MPYNFKLKIPKNEIILYSKRYEYNNEDVMCNEISPKIQKQKYLTKDDLLFISRWKSPRITPLAKQNNESLIKEVTSISLTTKNDILSIGVLQILKGVSWPVASVILHFGKKDLYPILDYRALWSVGIKKPNVYSYDLWISYVKYCRKLAKELNISMKTLDKALWQYSKERQK